MKRMPLLIVGLAASSIAGCKSEKTTAVEDRQKKTMEQAQEEQRDDVSESRVTSKDGTKIAFEKDGDGPAVIVVSGALSSRELLDDELVDELSERLTVYTYDRRGRGESTDEKPYAVEREIEDIQALVRHAGGSAYLYGVSSGAALALQAAAKLGPGEVAKLALYEPPYGQDKQAFAGQKQRINELAKTGEPGEAAEFFMTAIGTPPERIQDMKRSKDWEAMKKIDFTLAYDYEVLGDGAVPEETARAVTVPTLVMNGAKSMEFMQPTADRIARAMPRAERKILEGQTHQAKADVVAPVLIEFFTRAQPNR
ncbi:MAG TPA: alpha/beta hydrolase [Polyangiaceae bacterium]